MKIAFGCVFALLLFPYLGNAQLTFQNITKGKVDTNYYQPLNKMVTLKAFSAQKYSDFSLSDNTFEEPLSYNANPTRALGLGFSYQWLGLNLGYGFSFANNDDERLGETQRIDFLTHIHLRKLTLKLYTSWYQGFYLSNSSETMRGYFLPEHYYTRGDIKQTTLGLSATYVFNSERYSNKAVFLQNEWQKKTAGSFVAGGSIFYNGLMADSSFIPTQIAYPDFFNGVGFNQSGFFGMGGHVGYTLTLVFKEHWFTNFALMGGFGLGQNTIYPTNDHSKKAFKLNINLLNDVGFGYNSERWYAGFSFSSFNANSSTAIKETGLGYSSGKYQFVVAYRIVTKKRIQLPAWIPFKL